MTNISTQIDIKIRSIELAMSLLNQIEERDIEQNNLNRDIEQTLYLYSKNLKELPVLTLFISSLFKNIRNYVNKQKNKGIVSNEDIEISINALRKVVDISFDSINNEVITKH